MNSEDHECLLQDKWRITLEPRIGSLSRGLEIPDFYHLFNIVILTSNKILLR